MEADNDGKVGTAGEAPGLLDARREGEHGEADSPVHGSSGDVVRRNVRLPILGDDATARQGTPANVAASMKVRICKAFDFDAAHFLPNVAANHKCRRMHGHTYRVEVMIDGVPDERGMVVDYAEIAIAWDPIHMMLDHRVLNEVAGLENPTTELLAPWILRMFTAAVSYLGVMTVRVYESATTWCEVSQP